MVFKFWISILSWLSGLMSRGVENKFRMLRKRLPNQIRMCIKIITRVNAILIFPQLLKQKSYLYCMSTTVLCLIRARFDAWHDMTCRIRYYKCYTVCLRLKDARRLPKPRAPWWQSNEHMRSFGLHRYKIKTNSQRSSIRLRAQPASKPFHGCWPCRMLLPFGGPQDPSVPNVRHRARSVVCPPHKPVRNV